MALESDIFHLKFEVTGRISLDWEHLKIQIFGFCLKRKWATL